MRHLITILLILIFASCSTMKEVEKSNNRLTINEENIYLLDGTYALRTTDDNYRLLDYLVLNKSIFKSTNNNNCTVRIKVISSKLIDFKFFEDRKLIEERKIKGFIKDGYFYMNLRTRINFFLIGNFCAQQRSRISLLKNNNLIADTKGGGCALLVLFPINCSGFEEYELEYPRIDK